MEITKPHAQSYNYQTQAMKQKNIYAQYQSINNSNLNTLTSRNSEPFSVNISYPGQMAQAEMGIYDSIENEVLGNSKTENVEKPKMQSSEDFYSPESVSTRITDFARSLFPMWMEQNDHLEMTDEEAVEEFMSLVNSGVEKGFEESEKILRGFGMFDESEDSTFNTTADLTRQKLNDLSSVLFEDLEYFRRLDEENSDVSSEEKTDYNM